MTYLKWQVAYRIYFERKTPKWGCLQVRCLHAQCLNFYFFQYTLQILSVAHSYVAMVSRDALGNCNNSQNIWHKTQGHHVPLVVSGEDQLGCAGAPQHRNNNHDNGVAVTCRNLGFELNPTLLFRFVCHLGHLLL